MNKVLQCLLYFRQLELKSTGKTLRGGVDSSEARELGTSITTLRGINSPALWPVISMERVIFCHFRESPQANG